MADSPPHVVRHGARCATLLLALLALLGAAEPTITLRADPAQATIGDRVDLTVVYRWPAPWQPQREPDPGGAFDALQLTQLVGPTRRSSGDTTVVTWYASLVVERSGTWALPRPQLRFVHPDGRVRLARAPEVLLTTEASAEPPDLAQARGLWLPPRELTEPPTRWWPLAALVGGVLALLAVLWWRRRRARRPAPDARETFATDLEAARRIADGRQAGIALSAALRRYCGARWGFDGVGATGPEVVQHVGDGVPAAERARLRRLFEHLDGLLWAPEALAAATVVPLLDQAEDWVADEERRRVELAAAEEERAA